MTAADPILDELRSKALQAGATAVVASDQYGMRFLLVDKGSSANIGGILHRDDSLPWDDLVLLAASLNQILASDP